MKAEGFRATRLEAGKDFAHACELGLSGWLRRRLAGGCGEPRKRLPKCLRSRRWRELLPFGVAVLAGGGVPKDPGRAFALLQRSCSSGWWRGCAGLAECYRAGVGTPVDNRRAIEEFDKACQGGVASSCFSASAMYRGPNDVAKAEKRLRQGCQISAGLAASSAAYFETGLPAKVAVPAICSSTAR